MEKTNNKKRVAIIVAIIALITAIACLGTFTLARYISSLNVDTTKATVAKWGFTLKADVSSMFGKNYTVDGSNASATVFTGTGDGVAVKATANAVAPGTEGKMEFEISGKADVLAVLKCVGGTPADVNLSRSAAGEVTAVDYSPISWKLEKSSDGTTWTEITTNSTLSDVIAKLTATTGSDVLLTVGTGDADITAASGGGYLIKAGTDIGKVYRKISWSWPLNNAETESDSDKKTEKQVASANDTLLGYAAQGAGTYWNGADKVVVSADSNNWKVEVYSAGSTGVTYTYTAKIAVDLALTLSVEQVLVAPTST